MEILTSLVLWSVCTLLVCILVYLDFRNGRWKRWRLPPGPRPLPLIGNLLQICRRDLHLALQDMAEKYGGLVWLKLGSEKVLVVNTIDAVMDTFVRQTRVFSGRPAKRKTVDTLLGNGLDIVMNDIGPELKYHRKVVHTFLASQQKLGKNRLHRILDQESESLMKSLEKLSSGGSFDPKLYVARVVANVLCQSILDRRFEDTNEAFHEQLSIVNDIVGSIESFNIVDILPWLAKFPIPSWVRFKKSLERRDVWIGKAISEHRERKDHEDPDLLQEFLRLQKEALDNKDTSLTQMLSDKTIGHIVHELFGGGIESTTLTILWFMIYMIHNPHWQQKLADEVLSVSQEDGGISPFKKSNYPLLEAAIKETLRMASILPLGFPHRTTERTNVSGYDVPADTMVIMNIWTIHHSSQTWKDPYTFNPERFLEDGKLVYQRGYIPFGMGGRVCLGSTVAKMEVFTFCAHILSQYEIHPGDVDELPDLEGTAGLTIRPKPFSIRLVSRNNNTDSESSL